MNEDCQLWDSTDGQPGKLVAHIPDCQWVIPSIGDRVSFGEFHFVVKDRALDYRVSPSQMKLTVFVDMHRKGCSCYRCVVFAPKDEVSKEIADVVAGMHLAETHPGAVRMLTED